MDSPPKVAILVDNYFEQIEFTQPRAAALDEGADVVIVGTSTLELQGMEHAELADEFTADILIDEVDFEEFDMLIIPGGAINADTLRMNEKARDWVNFCMDNNVPLAVICHGPWLLASAGVAEGHKLTSFYTIQDDMRNAGADWVDEPLVIDHNLITSRKPDDIPDFNTAIVEALRNHSAEH